MQGVHGPKEGSIVIWRPKSGDRVVLRYKKSARGFFPHNARGTVFVAGRGPGPINAEIILEEGRRIVVPRGNLFKQ